MVFHPVEISLPARSDADEIIRWITSHYGKEVSAAWYNGLLEAISSLEKLPRRCAYAPESKNLEREVRQLFYSKTRIVFGIHMDSTGAEVVRIFRIRHQAQKGLRPEDFIKK